MLSGEIHYLRYLRFRDSIRKDPAYADSTPVNVKHDLRRFLAPLAEKALKNMNDELHRRVVVVQH